MQVSSAHDQHRQHPPNPPASLAEAHALAWFKLQAGAQQRKHPYHLCTVATIGTGGAPELRTVVLRQANPAAQTLAFHTDARSPKVDHMRQDPRVSVLFYDTTDRVQVRIAAKAELFTEGEAFEDAWARTALFARRCYLAPFGPSTPRPEPEPNLPESVRSTAPSEAESEAGRRSFVLVRLRVRSLEVLSLAHDGHARCRLDYAQGGALPPGGPAGTWLAP